MARSRDVQKKADSAADIEKKLDEEVIYEFGGPLGALSIMLIAPCMMYYFYSCLQLNHGRMLTPHSWEDAPAFFRGLLAYIGTHAAPTTFGFTVYLLFCLFQFVLAWYMPGPIVKGLPIPSENGRQLEYRCNGVTSFYATLVVAFALHHYGIFPLTLIIERWGEIMTAAIVTANIITVLTYLVGVVSRRAFRMSGNVMYDIFMGAFLNPRIGRVDLKMWAEIRVPWVILFFLTVSCALKFQELHGYISTPFYFMILAHFLYVNACMKGEECIPTTWDIFYEKWGYMLIFWNFAGVPFTYCYSSIFLLKQASPVLNSPAHNALCFVLLLSGYYIWDTANSQKNRFRMKERGTYIPRFAFPQLPWGTLESPRYLTTKAGSKLLTDGWWAYARKIHYTADLMMALSWGLIAGSVAYLPFHYLTFFLTVLVHRVTRDVERCAQKYGEDWVEYCRIVPYIFIPYVY